MKKLGIVIVLVGVLLLVVLPAGLGVFMKSKIDEQVAIINEQPAYQVTIDDYQRGWFSSELELTLGIDPSVYGNTDDPELQAVLPEQISLQAHIDHGPVLWSKGAVGLAQLIGGLNLDKNPRLAVFGERAGIDALVSVEAYMSLAGNGQAYINSPEFEVVPAADDEAAIDFGGLQLVSHFSLAGASFDLEGAMPYLRVESNKAVFRLSNLGLAGNGKRVGATRVWAGQQEVNLELMSLTAQNADDLEIASLRFQSNVEEAEAGLLSGNFRFYIDEIRTPDSVLTGLESVISADQVSVEALDQYAGLMQSAGNRMNDPAVADEVVNKIEQLILPGLLAKQPVVNWETLRFSQDGEAFEGNGMAQFVDGAEAQTDLISSGNWRQYLDAEAHISASTKLAQELIAGFMEQQLEISVQQTGRPYTDEQIKQYADSQALVMLNMFTQQGFLQQTAAGYLIDFEMMDGLATINGQPLPFP